MVQPLKYLSSTEFRSFTGLPTSICWSGIFSCRAWSLGNGLESSSSKLESTWDRTGGSTGRAERNWCSLHWGRRQGSGLPPKSVTWMVEQLHEASHKGGPGRSPQNWCSGRKTTSSWITPRFVMDMHYCSDSRFVWSPLASYPGFHLSYNQWHTVAVAALGICY